MRTNKEEIKGELKEIKYDEIKLNKWQDLEKGVNIGNKRQVSVVEQGYVNIFIKDTGRVSVEQGHFRAVLVKDKCI